MPFKYFYQKPNSKKTDPAIILSAENVQGFPGEIIIGWLSPQYPTSHEIRKIIIEIFSCGQIFNIQRNYFGDNAYEPVRQELIRIIKNVYYEQLPKKIEEEELCEIPIPFEIREKIEASDWPF